MRNLNIQAIAPPCELGEGPHWIEEEQTLCYVDATEGKVLRYHEPTGENFSLHVGGGVVAFMIPVEGVKDSYVINVGKELFRLNWSGKDSIQTIHLGSVDEEYLTNHFNDAKCDRTGRLWTGTKGSESSPGVLPPDQGSIYSLEQDGSIVKRWSPVTLSNGLGWSQDFTRFYYIDSMEYSVDVFDFDITTPEISNRRKVYDFTSKKEIGIPDGMTIDANGKIWVACYLGHKIICVDPETGKKIDEIKFPVSNMTSCTFGGPSKNIMYATSSRFGLSNRELQNEPEAGSLFKIEGLQVEGTPCVPCKLNL